MEQGMWLVLIFQEKNCGPGTWEKILEKFRTCGSTDRARFFTKENFTSRCSSATRFPLIIPTPRMETPTANHFSFAWIRKLEKISGVKSGPRMPLSNRKKP